MLRTVFAAMAVGVFATPVFAGGGKSALDPATYVIGDRDAYEDDYSDEFEKATKEEYKAREGKKEKLSAKAWEFFEFIKDGDPMWSGPISYDGAGPFHSLNTRNPMEAARTLDKWDFYFSFSAQLYNQQFDSTHGHDPGEQLEDVHWAGVLGLGVTRLQIGLPWRFEVGLKYIFGELKEDGHNDIFWYEDRSQIIRDLRRHVGSKSAEVNLKWNAYRNDDGISGLAINLKYKFPMATSGTLLDTQSHEGGVNVIGSIKWGITSFHANVGWVYAKHTGTLFHARPDSPTDTDPDRVECRPFFTGGIAGTIQIFEFLLAVAQIELQTNAWERELDQTYDAKVLATASIGLRARVGPVLLEGSIGRGFSQEEPHVEGEVTMGIKF